MTLTRKQVIAVQLMFILLDDADAVLMLSEGQVTPAQANRMALALATQKAEVVQEAK